MERKYLIPAALMTLLLVGMVTASAMRTDFRGQAKPMQMSAASPAVQPLDAELEKTAEEMKEKIPATYEEAEKLMAEVEATPVPNRYLMWTRDGRHIMWGTLRGGYFTGEDNLGKKAWGIYHNGMFAGFYDGRFFYGRYSRGRWKAYGLFGLRSSSGRYVLFPSLVPKPVAISAME